MKKVHVLRTNIDTLSAMAEVSNLLNGISSIHRWSIDIEDIDNVLRVESESLTTKELIETLQQAGYSAEDLI